MRPHRCLIVLALLWSSAGVAPASAQTPTIDAPTGQALPAAGGVLVDIRSPREVAGTGRPEGAFLVPLQGDDRTFRGSFVADVAAAVGPDRARPAALIDADGRRGVRGQASREPGLHRRAGRRRGDAGQQPWPGRLARDLPVER